VTWIRHLIHTAGAHGLHLDEGPTAGQPVPAARARLDHAQRLWEQAVRVIGPQLPLLVAKKSPEDAFSPLYFAALACRTMGESLDLATKHWRYITEAFPIRQVRRGGTVHLHFELDARAPLGARLGAEYLLASLVRGAREISGGVWRPAEVHLAHRPPVAPTLWKAHCDAPVCFGSEMSGLVMDHASLALPVRGGMSRAAGTFFREVLEQYTGPAATLAERVTEALATDLGTSTPSVDDVAQRLALSTRSLHRQLAAEGTSYQRLLDGLRRDEAIRQAHNARRSLKEIAAAVGFADPRGFRRAFKRWTGSTPQQFRRRAPGRSELEPEPRADP
jgi:AraC-like DNA-binding protein